MARYDGLPNNCRYRIGMKCSWSAAMTVHVIGSEGCRTMGDAMRDLDARALIQGHFILMDANTITNAKLMNTLMKHKYCIMIFRNA